MITEQKDVLITNDLLNQIKEDGHEFSKFTATTLIDLIESFVSGCPRFNEWLCGDKFGGNLTYRRTIDGVTCFYVKEDIHGHRVYIILGIMYLKTLISRENRTLSEVDKATPDLRVGLRVPLNG